MRYLRGGSQEDTPSQASEASKVVEGPWNPSLAWAQAGGLGSAPGGPPGNSQSRKSAADLDWWQDPRYFPPSVLSIPWPPFLLVLGVVSPVSPGGSGEHGRLGSGPDVPGAQVPSSPGPR